MFRPRAEEGRSTSFFAGRCAGPACRSEAIGLPIAEIGRCSGARGSAEEGRGASAAAGLAMADAGRGITRGCAEPGRAVIGDAGGRAAEAGRDMLLGGH